GSRGRAAVRGGLSPLLGGAQSPGPAEGAGGAGRPGGPHRHRPLAHRQLARARGVGHVRRPLRRAPRPAPPSHGRALRGPPAAQGLSDQSPPAPHRAEGLAMADTREMFLSEGAPSGGEGSKPLYVNMGPAHPAMHGIVRILAELDGETVVKTDVEIGYLHRAFEKQCESGPYNNAIPYTDRLDYVSPLINNFGYCSAIEKL